MVVVKGFVNGYEVINSGVIHLAGSTAQLVLDGMPIDIIFKDDGGVVRFSAETEGNAVRLSLFNFGNALGEGRIDPFSIASVRGRDVKFTFFVHTVDKAKSERVISYTFLMGPEANG